MIGLSSYAHYIISLQPSASVAPHAGVWNESYVVVAVCFTVIVSYPTLVRGVKENSKMLRTTLRSVAPHEGARIERRPAESGKGEKAFQRAIPSSHLKGCTLKAVGAKFSGGFLTYNHLLADLQLYADSGLLNLDNIDENLVNSGKTNGKLTGIPLSSSMLALSPIIPRYSRKPVCRCRTETGHGRTL